jgi:hypothetical protein
VSREIDRTKPLGEASAHDLLIALGDVWGASPGTHLTRSAAVEVRHVCLYVRQALEELRTHAGGAEPDMRHVLLELTEQRAALAQLQAYIETGRGGTSSLGARTRQPAVVHLMRDPEDPAYEYSRDNIFAACCGYNWRSLMGRDLVTFRKDLVTCPGRS